jgi:hypothetical protein
MLTGLLISLSVPNLLHRNGMSHLELHNELAAVSVLQAKLYPRILAAMKPGATLGLSHGFLLGVMQNDGVDFREDINVILNAPKVRMGCPSPQEAGHFDTGEEGCPFRASSSH